VQSIYCFNPNCLQVNIRETKDLSSYKDLSCKSCGAVLTLKNRYRAIEVLQDDRLSQTFRVRDLLYSNDCILKQIAKNNDRDTYLEKLFINLQQIEHCPDIPKHSDRFTVGNYYYLVREFIAGDNLEKLVDRTGVFEVDRVWQFLLDILPILERIHSYNLVDRAIEPKNIIYSQRSHKFIVADWSGLIKIDDFSSMFITSVGYSAPEIFQRQSYFSSNLYSLGAICLYLLTGMHPFELFDTIDNSWVWRDYWQPETKVVYGERETRLGEIIDRIICIDPDCRLQSATDVLQMMGVRTNNQKMTVERKTKEQKDSIYSGRRQRLIDIEDKPFSNYTCIDCSDDFQVIAGGCEDKKISIWESVTGNKIVDLCGHQSKISSLKFAANNNILVSGDSKGKIIIWHWNIDRNLDNNAICELESGSGINSIALHPVSPIFASGHIDKKIRIWDRQTQELITTLSGHSLAVTDLQFDSTASLLASASQDRTIKLWQVDSWELQHTFKGHNWAVKTVAFNANASILASAGDGKDIKIWDIKTHQLLYNLSGHSWTISRIAFLRDSNNLLLSSSWDKKIKLWDVVKARELAILEGHQDSIFDLATATIVCDREYSIVTTSKDKTIGIWDLKILI
jgi:WD40 repeat protein